MDEYVTARLLEYIERSSDFVGVTDDSGNVVYLNDAALRRLGRSASEIPNLTTADLFSESMFERYFEEIRPALLRSEAWNGILSIRTHDGVLDAWMTIVGGLGPGGDIQWLVTSGRDVTEWLHDRDVLYWQATHDELTGVARRSVLGERIAAALARARRNSAFVGVLYVDVNNFKEVNDALGHHIGDIVLAEVGRRLTVATREVDTVVRIGGDEFVVLAEGIADAPHAEEFATRLRNTLTDEPVTVGDTSVNVTVSVGLVLGSGESDPSQLLHEADAAMYRAKSEPEAAIAARWVEATEGPYAATTYRISVALTQQLIMPHYQPVARLADGVTIGYQALARWGQETSAQFVDSVQGSAVAVALDLAILRRATADAMWWEHIPRPMIYAHVSARLLAERAMCLYVKDLLDRSNLAPARLALEVPEPLLLERRAELSAALAPLRDMGVVLVASHVGALAPRRIAAVCGLFDQILFDRDVVVRLDLPAARTGPYRDIIDAAHAEGLTTIAVGIETDAQRDLMAELGCDHGIGYRFGTPTAR